MTTTIYDVAIIGGGINGCGCAADAALRGLSVVLCEQADLASKTSSSSTKLIHGGLRYLENYEFGLVKKALTERQLLLDLAPYLVQPLPLVLPYQRFMRPAWMLRLGLFLYDHLSRKNRLPGSRTITRNTIEAKDYFSPLKKMISKGFIFYDGIADDSRLTLANAIQAKNHGANILSNTRLIKAEVHKGVWQLHLQPKQGLSYIIEAKSLINATGPWVNSIAQILSIPIREEITWVKGSHIILPALYSGKHAYLLQHADKRIVFVIPYHGYSMIGTTDVAFQGDLNKVSIDEQEISYLCSLVNDYFQKAINPKEIVDTWSGVRPLLADPHRPLKSLSRDYKYHYSNIPAPNVTIYGGKITTYRKLAKEVVDVLCVALRKNVASITKKKPLPGAETVDEIPYSQFKEIAKEKYFWLETKLLERYLLNYGTRTSELLHNCRNKEDLGIFFGNSLYQKEVEFLIKHEWATTAEDILWRRTKLGLGMEEKDKESLENFLCEYFL